MDKLSLPMQGGLLTKIVPLVECCLYIDGLGDNKMEKNNWNATFYDHHFSYVSTYGNSLIELLAPKQGEKILDLGCGTGDLANTISTFGANVVGVDLSENMINQAIEKYPHIQFEIQDATKLDYDHEFDAVFSNATLHWVRPPIQALHRIYHSLKIGGRFVAEFGGKGNIETITSEIIKQIKNAGLTYENESFHWYFPSIAEYTSLMEKAGFRVIFAQHFDRPTPLEGEDGLRNFIKMFCLHLFSEIPDDIKHEIIANVEDKLRETLYKDGTWIADYKRIRVIGIKEQ